MSDYTLEQAAQLLALKEEAIDAIAVDVKSTMRFDINFNAQKGAKPGAHLPDPVGWYYSKGRCPLYSALEILIYIHNAMK